jgi:hypothetical protein
MPMLLRGSEPASRQKLVPARRTAPAPRLISCDGTGRCEQRVDEKESLEVDGPSSASGR